MAAPAIDRAIAKLDGILASVGGGSGPAASARRRRSGASRRHRHAAPQAAGASTSQQASSTPDAAVAAEPAAADSSSSLASAQAAEGGRDVLTAKAHLKVARILSAVAQPNSEKLLKLQADLGGDDHRQIMAGLAQYIKPEQLVGKLVCVVANLKPAKLAGEPSQAMVLAATAEAAGGPLVRTLVPPEGSQPGDLVHLDGCAPPAGAPKVLKKEDWIKAVPGLAVSGGGKATFEGTPLVTSQGLVTVPDEIPDGSEIH